MTRFSVLLVLFPVMALAEISHFNFSVDGDVTYGPVLNFEGGDVIQYDTSSDSVTMLLDSSAHFISGGRIDAVDVISDNLFVLSVDGNSTFFSGASIDDDDIVLYDSITRTALVLFDGDVHFKDKKGKPTEADVDAVSQRTDGKLVISISGSAFIDGKEVEDGDLFEFDPSDNSAVVVFDAGNFSSKNEDIDGAYRGETGEFVISVRNNADLGGISMDKNDIVQYDPSTGNAALLLDGDAVFSSNEELNALDVRSATEFALVTRNAAQAGGSAGKADVLRYEVATANTTRVLIGLNVFDLPNEDIDALYRQDSGAYLLSTKSDARINGVMYRKEDVLSYDPATDTASVFFSGNALLKNRRNIDAFHLYDDGRILFSVELGDDEIAGVSFQRDDLVLYDPATSTASVLFDGASLFAAPDEDVDAVHVLADGQIVLSTLTNASLAGVGFAAGDFVQYDPDTGTALKVFDGATVLGSGTVNADALFVEEAAVLSGADHFQIVHAGQGINCQAEQVTIRAMDAAGVLISDYTGTVTLDTSTFHGDWTNVDGNGSFSPGTADSGNATYDFVVADGGEVTLALRDTYVETVSINVIDSGGVTETSNNAVPSDDPDLVFVESGFRFHEGAPGANIQVQIAAKSSAVAPNGGGLGLQAIRTDTQTGACESFLVGANDIEMAFSCVSPAGCAGAAVTVTGAAGSVVLPEWNGGAATAPVTLDFGSDAVDSAPFSMVYPEAGSLRLHARLVLVPGTEAMLGQSAPFVVRPFGFALTGITRGATVNPGGTAAGGARFAAAGEGFDYTVGAYRWAAGEDDDGDGIPNVDADLADNGLTTQFAGAVDFSVGEITPTGPGSVSGLLGNGSATIAVGGLVAVTGQTYSEAGSLRVVATHSDYLGDAAADITSSSAVIGRFTPDRLALSSGTVAEYAPVGACGDGFVYMDEPALELDYTLQAHAVGGGVTTNYDATRGYAYTGTVAVVLENMDSGTDLAVRLDLPAAFDWVAGEVDYLFSTHSFSRSAGVDGPYNGLQAGVRVGGDPADDIGDPDGVDLAGRTMNAAEVGCGAACDAVPLAGALDVRQGRLRVAPAYGPETEPLPVPVDAEYWDGIRFLRNTADQCTLLVAAQVDLEGVDDDNTPDHGSDPAPGTLSVAVDTGATTGLIGNAPFVAGSAGFVFGAPGLGNTGYVNVDLDLSASNWLQHDWDGDGVHNENPPTARVVFGRYRGDDRIIYWREVIE